jgi:branched-chain amino acid transport system permease protein
LGLAALGLSLIFGTMGLTNFGHGELVTFGAIVAWFLNDAGLPVIAAGALAVVISGAFGWAQDAGFWRPLRRRGSGLIAMMIISIGVGLILRYLYLYFFSGQRRSYDQFVIQRALDFGPFGYAPRDLWIMGIALIALGLVATALIKTRIGKATRAVSDNPALAAASGIDVDRVISTVWIVGTALAGLAGVLFGLIQQVDYLMGFRVLLLVFAAVVLGGLGTAWGAMIGALIVGVFIEVSTLVIPSELKYAGVLAVLILILLVRPQGILGRRERIG